PELAKALQEINKLAASLNGNPGSTLSMADMIETFNRVSAGTLAQDLASAKLSASFRNQEKANEGAQYGVEPKGHVGIGVKAYMQWTSPIRRYTDLDVHRALDRLIDEKQPNGRLKVLDVQLREFQHERANRK